METEDPVMRERLVGLKLQRDQTAKEIGELQNRMASSTATITPGRLRGSAGYCGTNFIKGLRSSGRPTPGC